MTENPVKSNGIINFRIILAIIIVFLVVLLAPFAYHFDLGPGPDSIEAVIWHYIESPWYTGFRFQDPLRYFPYVFVRLLFLIQFCRYVLGKTSQKKTLLIAAFSELHVALLSLPVYISWFFHLGVFLAQDGDPILPIFSPLPFLFPLVAVLILLDKRRSK